MCIFNYLKHFIKYSHIICIIIDDIIINTAYSDKNHIVDVGNIVDNNHNHIVDPQNIAFTPHTWAADTPITAPIIHIIDFFVCLLFVFFL